MTAPLSNQPKDKRCRHPYTNILLTKALDLTTQNMMDQCLPAIDLIVIQAIMKDLETRQGIGLRAQPLMSLKTQMGIGHLRQNGGKGPKPQKAKIPRAKDMWDQHLQAQSLLIGSLNYIIMHMMIQIALVFMQLAMKNLYLNI